MTRDSLLALERELEGAKEGSRELDARIESLTAKPFTNWSALAPGYSYGFEVCQDDERRVTAYISGKARGKVWKRTHQHYAAPLYTDSIDAALALMSRVLPDHAVTVTRFSVGVADAKIWAGKANCWEATRAPNPALAVCLAAVRALAQAEDQNV